MTSKATPPGSDAKYRTAWRRCGAALVDGVILNVFAALTVWAGVTAATSVTLVSLYVLNTTLILAYSIGFHGRCGQTPGKMLMRVKVVDIAEAPIGLRRAALRDSPLLVIGLVGAVSGTTTVLAGNNPFRLEYDELLPVVLGFFSLGWCGLKLVTMVSNRRRRAVHDFIARTVVVRV